MRVRASPQKIGLLQKKRPDLKVSTLPSGEYLIQGVEESEFLNLLRAHAMSFEIQASVITIKDQEPATFQPLKPVVTKTVETPPNHEETKQVPAEPSQEPDDSIDVVPAPLPPELPKPPTSPEPTPPIESPSPAEPPKPVETPNTNQEVNQYLGQALQQFVGALLLPQILKVKTDLELLIAKTKTEFDKLIEQTKKDCQANDKKLDDRLTLGRQQLDATITNLQTIIQTLQKNLKDSATEIDELKTAKDKSEIAAQANLDEHTQIKASVASIIAYLKNIPLPK